MKIFNIVTTWLANNHELGIVVSITTFLTTVVSSGTIRYVTLIIAVLIGLVTLYGKVMDEIHKNKKRK